jgi:PAS domain S-box-containing protein
VRLPGTGWLLTALVLTQAGLTLTVYRLSAHAAPVEIWLLILLSAIGPLTLQYVALRRRPSKAIGGTSHWMPLLVEHALDPFILMNPSGGIMRWNGPAEQLLGWAGDEVVGRQLAEIIVPPQQRASFQEAFRRVPLPGRLRVEARHRRGHLITVEIRISLLRSGGAGAYALFLSDLTERTRLEAHLHALQQLEAIGHVAGGVAHDLNNMLLVIGAYSELLKEDPSLGGTQREGVRQIGQATKRAADLTGRLLAFSRREALSSKTVHLNDLIASLEPMLKPLLGEGIEFVSVLDPASGCLQADPSQIERVLINLCLNARDAMPQGGRLLIMTDRVHLDETATRRYQLNEPGPYARLVVRDTGIGMDAETLSRAFERFFTTKSKGQGTGLGLASVSEIVAECQGAITISSKPGLGTSVLIYLPLVQAPESVGDGPEVHDGAEKDAETNPGDDRTL